MTTGADGITGTWKTESDRAEGPENGCFRWLFFADLSTKSLIPSFLILVVAKSTICLRDSMKV